MGKRMFILTMIFIFITQSNSAFAKEFSFKELFDIQNNFCMSYPYKEGDVEKSMELYNDIFLTSGIETSQDGINYEYPGMYYDPHAMLYTPFTLQKNSAELIINNEKTEFSNSVVLFTNESIGTRSLVPADVFGYLGATVFYDEERYVLKIEKNGTTLEILPNLIAMRKNEHDGFYVPLQVCARFIDDVLYIPVRAIADELNINVDWDNNSFTVFLTE